MDVGATPAGADFCRIGATGPMVRTFLLRDRRFVGQRFRCGGFQAVLLAGGGMIEFYDQAGVLVKTVRIAAQEEKAA